MLTIASFASLAQLGSGLALALTIFVEPIAARERRYRNKLEGALQLLPRDGSDKTKAKENEIWISIINLDAALKRSHQLARWPLILIKLAAVFNFIILLWATLVPDAEVSDGWMWTLLGICILPVAMGSGLLSLIAQVKIGGLDR